MSPGPDRRDLAIVLALALACVAIYAQTISFDFVGYDDEAHVTLNAVTQRGLEPGAVAAALRETVAANWHPLTQLSHMLDVELFGLEAGGHHAVNLLLHVIASLLVYGVLRAATGARWRSAVVAGLFAVHPLHVEAVAWISQRKTLLCTVFGLASTWAYLVHARTGSGRARALSVALLAAGLLSKAMLVTLPVLFLLLDAWPLGRRSRGEGWRPLVVEKLPWLVPVVVIALVTIAAQSEAEAVAPLTLGRFVGVHLPNAVLGYAWYVEKALWPSGLAVHYPHPYLPLAGGEAPPPWRLVAAAGLLIAIGAVAWRTRRSAPWLAFGAAWGAVALLPVIGLLQVGTQAVADRYAYLSLLGPFVAVVWQADALRSRWRLPAAAAAIGTVVVLGALGLAAHRQVGYWRDAVTLHARGVAVSPRDVTLLFNLGNARMKQGDAAAAEALYRRALAVHPGSSPAQLNLAELLRKHGAPEDLPEAVDLYRSVLVDRPGNFRATRGLRQALLAMAEQRLE